MNELAGNPEKLKTKPPTFKDRFVRLVKKMLMTVCIAYLLIIVALLMLENQMIYPVAKFPAGNWRPSFAHEDIEFTAADGIGIHAWLLRPSVDRETPRYFLYCHGNGENVAHSSGWIGQSITNELGGNVLIFDYRGYGKSEGSPQEAGIKLDAERALEVLCDKFSIKPDKVILMGSSLGGAVATHLAATQGCKALVVQRTFSSLPDVAASKYPWIPVRYLMQNNFDSATAIENYDGPLFQSHGESDRIVPIRFGEKLFAKSPSQNKTFVRLPGIGHNDGYPPGYWGRVDKWLDQIETVDSDESD